MCYRRLVLQNNRLWLTWRQRSHSFIPRSQPVQVAHGGEGHDVQGHGERGHDEQGHGEQGRDAGARQDTQRLLRISHRQRSRCSGRQCTSQSVCGHRAGRLCTENRDAGIISRTSFFSLCQKSPHFEINKMKVMFLNGDLYSPVTMPSPLWTSFLAKSAPE